MLTYPECIADFPVVFGADFMAVDPSASVSMTDPLLEHTAELDDWMTVRNSFRAQHRLRELADPVDYGQGEVGLSQEF